MAPSNRTPAEVGAERLAVASSALRPYVELARGDPELQGALREAVAAGTDVSRELAGERPKRLPRRLAEDRELQARLGVGVQALAQSALILRDERRKARRQARVQALLAGVGALSLAGLSAVVVQRRRRIEGQTEPEPAGES